MNYFDETIWHDFKDSANETKVYKKLLKEVDTSYRQRIYAVELRVRINKVKGGNKEQTLDEIRGIPGITVVSLVPGTHTSDEASYLSTLKCKFELIQNKDPAAYRNNILIPSLVNINGLSIRYLGKPIEVRIA